LDQNWYEASLGAGADQSQVRLPMHLVEPRSAEQPAKTGSAHISATAGPISTKIGVWMHIPCASIILKNCDDQGAQRGAEPQKPEVPISQKPLARF